MSKINWSTVLRLGIASLVVGTILAAIGANPLQLWQNVWHWVTNTFADVFGAGVEGVTTALRYTAVGAGVVLPVYLFTRLLKLRRPSKTAKPPAE